MYFGAGFRIIRDSKDKGAEMIPISSQTVAVGDLLDLAVGSTTWTVCTSSSVSYTRKALAVGTATSSDSEVLAIRLDGEEDVQAQSGAASSASHNGDRMALTDKNTVDNSGTDITTTTVGFVQRGVVGATADNQIWGHVLVGNGVVSVVS